MRKSKIRICCGCKGGVEVGGGGGKEAEGRAWRGKLCPLRSPGVPSSFCILTLSSLWVFPLSKLAHHYIYTLAQGKGGRGSWRQVASFQGCVLFCSHPHHFCSYPRSCFLFIWLLLAVMLSAKSLGILLLKEQNERLVIGWQILL